MSKKLFYTLLLYQLLLLCGKSSVLAQDSTKVDAWDRSAVDYRPASVERMEAYKNMAKYRYDRFEQPESLWDKIKRWILSKIMNSGISSNVIMYILIGIAVLILLFIILKLIGVNITGLFIFTRDTQVTNLNFKAGHEDIYQEDLESILKVAIKNKAYREAVRIMYLLCLRQLDSNACIDWKPWKTNKDYYYEIKDQKHKELFKELVLSYEYVWYGQFKVKDEHFEIVQNEFSSFNDVIGQSKKSA